MADNHPALNYAHFRLKDKVGLPANLLVGNEEFLVAANQPLPKPSLQKDYELVAQYGDWSKQKAELENQRRLLAQTPATGNCAEISVTISTTDATPTMVATSSATIPSAVSAVDGSSGSAATISMPLPPTGALQRSITAEDKKASQELAVAEMMRETSESKDVCIFYLESTNWDLNSAVELLRTMQVR